MKNITYMSAFAAIAVAGFVGVENIPFASVPAYAQAATVNVADVAKNFNPEKNLDLSGERVVFKLPAGIEAKIIGTTYEQLVKLDGEIRNPISPKTTKLTFELSDASGKKAQTKTFEVSVPETKSSEGGSNPKPTVIPALQEWSGDEGAFVPAKNFRVRIYKKDANVGKPTLKERAELFASELSEMFGKKVELVVDDETIPRRIGADIRLVLFESEKSLGKEGYSILSRKDKFHVIATDPLGIFWGTRTILQVFNQHNNTFPCGLACDYPQYPVRGFMYDVGRKPATMEAVKNVMKTMSYYKLNDLQLHLNDNHIWLHDYTEIPNGQNASPEDKKRATQEILTATPTPTAFRLESKVVGKNGIPLTATDHSYSKKEFGAFIDEAKLYGVNIVPEIDVPGHAMSFVRVRPELMYRGGLTKNHDVERAAMLDASGDIFDQKTKRTYREETLSFVQSVFDEYLVAEEGEEPVFRDCVVHIGTDEYYGNSEDYRTFASEMLKYVKSRGHTPRLWGSLSRKGGKTPVDGTDAQTGIWALSWQTPHAALQHNFDIINILDTTSYIVPNGTGNVGGYADYLNLPFLYSQAWHPHTMSSHHVMPGHQKLLGAQWALWNDNSFIRTTGLTDYDLFDRIRKSCAVFAEKTWNTGEENAYGEFMNLVSAVKLSPLSNPEYAAEPIDDEDTLFELTEKAPEGTVITTGIQGIAPDYVAEFRVKRSSDKKSVQTLSAGPTGKILAVQKDTGKVGFTSDTWDYSFDYTLPVGKTVTLKFIAQGRSLTLFVDGKEIGAPVRHLFPKSHKYTTLVFPLATIGEKENAFAGEILSLNIKRWVDPRTKNALIADEIRSVRANSEQGKDPDGDASKIADGNTQTYWHSKYTPKDNPPFEIIVELKKPTTLTAFTFLPRQGNENGNVKRAELFLKKDDGSWEKVGSFNGDGKSYDLQMISFSEKTTDALKFVILDGNGGFGTLAEIYPIKK